ncbi:MAG: flagellar biosynthesis protein FlhB [Chitinispirillales bacterium]|jgi:flagellar biosynthetic protein FlhB|nr:flagellar biosynthesis protein FlhB [Chitinispirillales bacterium]
MPEEEDSGEKTEEPTSKRREDARKEGNVSKSTEVSTVFVLLAALLFLRFFFKNTYIGITNGVNLAADYLKPEIMRNISYNTMLQILNENLLLSLKSFLPVALFIMFWGIFSNLIQVGFLFTTKPLEPKLSKINPISGFKRMFSMRSIVETVKNVMKLVVIGFVAYIAIKGRLNEMMSSINESVSSISVFMMLLIFDVSIKIVLTLLVIAILDYAYQRYEYERKLKMTKQQIKDEHKMTEGNPQIKGRIRQLQREMSRRRMMENVPKATVVVTNPTHLSIAIQYEQETMEAPLIVAKGADNIALKIREIAKEHNIPLYEDVPLARAMYDKVEPGDSVPQEFFAAVAEIIAYVYRLQGKTV